MSRANLSHGPRVTLKITPEIIARSVARNSSHCILAEAVKEAVPKAQRISVDTQSIRWTDPDKRERYCYLTPYKGQQIIVAFDQGITDALQPTQLRLRDPHVVPGGDALRENRAKYKKKKMRRPKDGTATSVPVLVGGRLPPVATPRRRGFGLRKMEF